MKFTYKRKVHDDHDDWQDCEITNLKKGDVFYIMEGEQEGPFLTAKSDAELRLSAKDCSKVVWHIKTEAMSDDNFL